MIVWEQLGGQHVMVEESTGRVVATLRQEANKLWLAQYQGTGEVPYISAQKARAAMEMLYEADRIAAETAKAEQEARKKAEEKKAKGKVNDPVKGNNAKS